MMCLASRSRVQRNSFRALCGFVEYARRQLDICGVPCPPPPPCLLSSQAVLDASNIRPLLAALGVGCVLAALHYFSHNIAKAEATERRRRMYSKTGSFVPPVSLPDAPQDVRHRSCLLARAGSTLVDAPVDSSRSVGDVQ
jgi:hypothetical protein